MGSRRGIGETAGRVFRSPNGVYQTGVALTLAASLGAFDQAVAPKWVRFNHSAKLSLDWWRAD